jgi:hypothetical protein
MCATVGVWCAVQVWAPRKQGPRRITANTTTTPQSRMGAPQVTGGTHARSGVTNAGMGTFHQEACRSAFSVARLLTPSIQQGGLRPLKIVLVLKDTGAQNAKFAGQAPTLQEGAFTALGMHVHHVGNARPTRSAASSQAQPPRLSAAAACQGLVDPRAHSVQPIRFLKARNLIVEPVMLQMACIQTSNLCLLRAASASAQEPHWAQHRPQTLPALTCTGTPLH